MIRQLHSTRHRALVLALIEARRATGLSQREFAKKLGRPNNFMWRVEIGERQVSVLDCIDIANAAGVSPADLICRVTGRKAEAAADRCHCGREQQPPPSQDRTPD